MGLSSHNCLVWKQADTRLSLHVLLQESWEEGAVRFFLDWEIAGGLGVSLVSPSAKWGQWVGCVC